MHTFECDDSDGSHITTSCSNHPQYFMNILPLSVPSSIFYIILACSAFFLWKKVSFLSICSQTIAGVRQYRQKKWEEREKKEIRERERERKKGLRALEKIGDWWETSSKGEAAAVSELPSFLFFTPSHAVRLPRFLGFVKVCPLKRRRRTPEGTKTKRGAVFRSGKGEREHFV